MLRNLRRQLTLLCAALTGAVFLGVSLLSLRISEGQLVERGQALFESSVNAIAFRMRTDSVMDWDWLAQMEAQGTLMVHLEDNGMPLLFGTGHGAARTSLVQLAQEAALEQFGVNARERPRSALNSEQALFSLSPAKGETWRAAVVVMRTESGYQSLTVLGNTTEEGAAIRRQRWLYAGIGIGGVLLLLVFSWWFAGRAIRPVAKSRQRQAEFIAAASHELRTPLAVIGTSAAALRHGLGGEQARFVGAIERECGRTAKLVDDLLVLANADASNWTVQYAPVEVDQVLRDTADGFRARLQERGQRLELDAPPVPVIAGDEHRLQQLVGILLDNACRYAPRGGVVGAAARRTAKGVRLVVWDNGPGIPPDQRGLVLERFYRADASRSEKEHYGLGLSIASEIVRLHRGKLLLSEPPGGGLTVTVDLPDGLRRQAKE